MEHGWEQINEEIADNSSHDVHHKRNRNKWTQDAQNSCKDHKANVEIFEMLVLHFLYIKLN